MGECSPIRRKRAFDKATITSVHQLHQLLAPDIPIRLRRVEAAFSVTEGFEFSRGLEPPGGRSGFRRRDLVQLRTHGLLQFRENPFPPFDSILAAEFSDSLKIGFGISPEQFGAIGQ